MIQRHLFFFCILVIATVIRFQGISRNLIFIGDQGRDFLVARELVTQGKIPLLGIPSSVPRFKQGPLFIYFLAITYWASGGSMLATGFLSASFSLAAIVALYLLLFTYTDIKTATISTAIFAVLPMLILHARMPYHIVPIPLFVILYLWQLQRLYRQQKWSGFGVGLGFALVFQFELAAFPLILLIPFVVILAEARIQSTKYSEFSRSWIRLLVAAFTRMTKKEMMLILFGLGVGLIPQILFDLTHHFAQLGGFLLWVLYRIGSALVPFTHHSFTDSSTPLALKDLLQLFLSLCTQNGLKLDQGFWGVLIASSLAFLFWNWKKSTDFQKIVVAGFLVLLAGLVVHRVPSEAYVPLLAPFAIACLAFFLTSLPNLWRGGLIFLIALSLTGSLWVLERQTFFLLQPGESDWNVKRFGPSLQTQREIVNGLFSLSNSRCVRLASRERDLTFPTLYNHLEYLIAIDPRTVATNDCVVFLIDRPESAKQYWGTTGVVHDFGAYWVTDLSQKPVYAKL